MSERGGLRAVVDTNLFVSGMVNPRGRPGQLLDRWRAGEFVLVLSEEQHAELDDVFSRSKLVRNYRISPRALAELFTALAIARREMPGVSIPLPVRDAKDEQIIVAALGGNAHYVVTGDNDLLVLRDDPRLGSLQIVTVNQFLELLEQARDAATE